MDERKAELTRKGARAARLEQLKGHEGWQDLKELLESQVELYKAQIESSAFVDDHNGYLNARAHLTAYKTAIGLVENSDKTQAHIAKQMDKLEEQHERVE